MTRPLPRERAAIIVVGLGYGDEAKGATVDYLAHAIPDTAAVVRWSGGAQAAHNVIHGPRHHTFRQFGSASLLNVSTLLRAPMVVDPLALGVEAVELERIGVHNALGLVRVDARCLVTTPIHVALNRAREEARGAYRHGSCGMGIGETIAYALAASGHDTGNLGTVGTMTLGAQPPRAADLTDAAALSRSLGALMRYAEHTIGADAVPTVGEMTRELLDIGNHLRIDPEFDEHLSATMDTGSVVFEGSQGMLLDEFAGFHPHTTWATLSPGDATGALPGPADADDDALTAAGLPRVGLRAELQRAGFDPYALGLTRSYHTRHGAGPFPTEDATQDFPEPHNGVTYQGSWRQGPLDLVTLGYAARAARADGMAVSHLDAPVETVATRWEGATLQPAFGVDIRDENTAVARAAVPVYESVRGHEDVIARIEDATHAPVVLTADGPARMNRRFR